MAAMQRVAKAALAPFLVVPKLAKRSWTARDGGSQDIANLYCSVEVALDTKSPVRMVTCLLQLGLLLSIQILYSFGYWDASTLQMGVSTLPAFMDTMDLSLLYSTSVLEGSNLTLVNLLCSLCSLALLAPHEERQRGHAAHHAALQLLLLGDGDHVLGDGAGRMGSLRGGRGDATHRPGCPRAGPPDPHLVPCSASTAVCSVWRCGKLCGLEQRAGHCAGALDASSEALRRP